MLLDELDCSGGKGGQAGIAGKGGKGGAAGAGGDGYSWEERITVRDGFAVSWTTKPHERRPALSGRRGEPGKHGVNGKEGQDGAAGSLSIIQTGRSGTQTFSSCYHLTLRSYGEISSPDGIIEPGEPLELKQITLVNSGSMPTPQFRVMFLSLNEDEFIYPEYTAIRTSASISPGEAFTTIEALRFQIRHFPRQIPVTDSTFCIKTNIQCLCHIGRIQKPFSQISQQPIPIVIRYPIEMSRVSYTPTVGENEEAPFAIQIRNISNQPLGVKADPKRKLRISLKVAEGIQRALRDIVLGIDSKNTNTGQSL